MCCLWTTDGTFCRSRRILYILLLYHQRTWYVAKNTFSTNSMIAVYILCLLAELILTCYYLQTGPF